MSQKTLGILFSLCLVGSLLFDSAAGTSEKAPSSTVSQASEQKTATAEVYYQVLAKLEELKPEGSIQMRMGTEKNRYQLGDPFEIRFMTQDDCYVILLDIGSSSKGNDGDIQFLFPSRQFSDNKLKGGKVYSTAYDFKMEKMKVGPPEGVETINIFCSPEKLNLFETDFKENEYYIIKPTEAEKLSALLERLNQLEPHAWSGTSLQVFIGDTKRELRKYGALPPISSTGTTGKFWPPINSTGTTGKTETP
jgi:hypothetical protein